MVREIRAMDKGASLRDRAVVNGASDAVSAVPASVPSAWQVSLANGAVSLIREVGIYGLGGNDGCPCTSFEVRNVHVDVSCHKSEKTVRVWSHHMDYTDESYRRCNAALKPIADEVLRQVDAYYDAGGEYAADFAVRYCSWDEDHPEYAERQAQAIEAGTAETQGGSVHESAVGPADVPSPPSRSPNNAE